MPPVFLADGLRESNRLIKTRQVLSYITRSVQPEV